MTKRRILFLEDSKFENKRSYSSYPNALWLKRYMKADLQAHWVFSRLNLLSVLSNKVAWLMPGDCLYLSFHGGPGLIEVGREKISIDLLAQALDGAGTDRKIIFSSCSTLAVPDEQIDNFKRISGFDQIAGYCGDVFMKLDSRFEREFLLGWLAD